MLKNFACIMTFLFCSASAYADNGVWPPQVLRFDFSGTNFVDTDNDTTPPQNTVSGWISLSVDDRMSGFGEVIAMNLVINGHSYKPSDVEWSYKPSDYPDQASFFFGSNNSHGSGADWFYLSSSMKGEVWMQYGSVGYSGFYESYDTVGTVTTLPPVPEPETYAMMLAGLSVVGLLARRRRSAATVS
jgi:hypothetical protein